MKGNILVKKKFIYPVSSILIMLLIWQLMTIFLRIPIFILPSPWDVFKGLLNNWQILLHHTGVTLLEALIGLIIAAMLAFELALIMDRVKLIRWSILPILVASQTIPVMVLGPIFALWFGFGLLPKVLMVILMCFFPIVVNFTQGLAQVPVDRIELLQTMSASKWQIYKLVKLPMAMPTFFSGLRIAATYCIGGAVIGEWLSASAGLGFYMIRVKNSYQMDMVFATVVIIILLSLALNYLVASGLKIYYIFLRRNVK